MIQLFILTDSPRIFVGPFQFFGAIRANMRCFLPATSTGAPQITSASAGHRLYDLLYKSGKDGPRIHE
jgi:hypothetical protein